MKRLCSEVQRAFGRPVELPAAVTEGFADWRQLSRVIAAIAAFTEARVIGISGSQGSGKSSLARVLAGTLNKSANQADSLTATCSIDDFYLTKAQRRGLAAGVHPLLQTRGVPGTHDHVRLARILQQVHTGGGSLQLPWFDKGRDDRGGTRQVSVQRLILEGWCVGVAAQPEAALGTPCNVLEAEEDADGVWRRYVNEQIRRYYEPLWRHVDMWVHLRIPSFDQVYAWRGEQEQQLPPAQRMDATAMNRFIQHYERLTRWMWAAPAPGPGLVVQLNEQHNVATVTVSAERSIAP